MKDRRLYFHIGYWILVVLLLIILFGRSWGENAEAFYFVCLLLPVIMGTSYFINYFLVPRYLLKKNYFRFGLYFVYTVIGSLYLETLVLIGTFTLMLEFNFGDMNRNASDTLLLAVVMYMIVFFTSFLLMIKQLSDNSAMISELKEDADKLKDPFLQIISHRKPVRIPYDDIIFIESYSDHIKITSVNDEVTCKERISNLERDLPDIFLRIHRSFIVNLNKITRFDYNEVEVNSTALNIGRTYKKTVLKKLNENHKG